MGAISQDYQLQHRTSHLDILPGLNTISSRSALTICELLMRAQRGLLTRSLTDSAAERERFSLTVIPITFSVARSGLEELGKMIQVMTDVGRNLRETRDVFGTIAWMLQAILQSAFAVAQRFAKATGLRAKQVKQLEKLAEECDRTLGTLSLLCRFPKAVHKTFLQSPLSPIKIAVFSECGSTLVTPSPLRPPCLAMAEGFAAERCQHSRPIKTVDERSLFSLWVKTLTRDEFGNIRRGS